MHHVVKTDSGNLFVIVAEIAAANQKCMMRLVGQILMSGPASKLGERKGKIDGEKADHESELYVKTSEEMKHGSDGEDGGGRSRGRGVARARRRFLEAAV